MAVEPIGGVDRDALEGFYTDRRTVELVLDPVVGSFDVAHLKEVNRRIFQDLPGRGFGDVTPGQFRPAIPEGPDWMKNRALSTQPGSFFVAYSRMDASAQERLAKVLESVSPVVLRELKTADFVTAMAKLYTELDYAHPFSDGNSRTLRVFTQQLAGESGYQLDWEQFAVNDTGRDLLYIARDKSVNQLAKPHMQHEHSLLKIIQTEARVAHCRDLADLLRDVVRPLRAIAFESMPQADALQAHPDLAAAYKTLDMAARQFGVSAPSNPQAQNAALDLVSAHIQKRLNDGETHDFKPAQQRQPVPTGLGKSRG